MVAWYQSKVLNSDEDIIFHLLFCTTSSQDLNKKRPTNLSTSSYMFFDCGGGGGGGGGGRGQQISLCSNPARKFRQTFFGGLEGVNWAPYNS